MGIFYTEVFMIYDFIVKDNEGRDVSLREFEGQVILIVNTEQLNVDLLPNTKV